MRVCFVCLGNICRSPTAEAVMRRRVAEAGLTGTIEVESAGTGSWHVGDPPDARAAQEARARGFLMDGRARQFRSADFARFDLVLAMDEENGRTSAASPRTRTPRRRCGSCGSSTPARPATTSPCRTPTTVARTGSRPFELVDAACRGLIDHLRP